MRIDRLKTAPDRSGRFLVQLEDGKTMRLYRQTVEDFGLYSGMELSDEAFRQLQKSASAMSAKMRAVRIVSATNVSRKDLEQRLIQKGEAPGAAQNAVQWLEELHLVDDRNTAEQIVHSCISKGYGLSRAKQALYEKRIPKEYWQEALEDYPDQMNRILSFLKNKLDADSDAKAVKKAVDALIRKGHSYRVIRQALNQLSYDSEDLPEDE